MARTALVLIDLQVGLLDGAFDADGTIERIGSVLARARDAGIAIVHVQHDHLTYDPLQRGKPTWEIHPALAPRHGETIIHKHAADAFLGTDLEAELRRRDIERIVVGGMQSEYCVDTTVRRALSLGYDVTLMADGHTTSHREIIDHHNRVLSTLPALDHSAQVVPASDVALA